MKRPPNNPVNAMISFGNSLYYAACLSEIYRTQLNTLISYLHEPGERRVSLALDLSKVFKPILVDRTIFKLLNQKMIQLDDFDQAIYLRHFYVSFSDRETSQGHRCCICINARTTHTQFVPFTGVRSYCVFRLYQTQGGS